MMKTADELDRELTDAKSMIDAEKQSIKDSIIEIKDANIQIRIMESNISGYSKSINRSKEKIEKLKEKLPKLKEQLAKAKKREKAEGKKAPKPVPASTNSSDASEEE